MDLRFTADLSPPAERSISDELKCQLTDLPAAPAGCIDPRGNLAVGSAPGPSTATRQTLGRYGVLVVTSRRRIWYDVRSTGEFGHNELGSSVK